MHEDRSFWGWGRESEHLSVDEQEHLGAWAGALFGVDGITRTPPPTIDEIELRAPRIKPPPTLEGICSTRPRDRAGHSYGKSFRDIVRAYRRSYPNPPDIVAYPRTETDLVAVLDWCSRARIAAVPFGGGTSVVGGVEPIADDYAGTVSIDLAHLDRVLEIDRTSRAARIQGGIFGPALEDELRAHDLTLRHFPQSFEFSTLGGWIATRSGGHYASMYTHIDEFVESLRVVTPAGVMESRRLPASGAGPNPDRMFIGSEGSLGIITEAWMRLQDRPRFRATASVRFDDFARAVAAVRAIAQSGLYPTNCRLLDPNEALSAGGSGTESILVLGFESADHAVDAWLARAVECAQDHRGVATISAGGREGAAGSWRSAFLRAPYMRDALTGLGLVAETFETAVTWDRFDEFHTGVMEATTKALQSECGGAFVSCRFTHVYPDGPAPYYTCVGPATLSTSLERWDVVKQAAAEAISALGGTITHHHAVGRDHRPWYDRERPDLFASALRAAKSALDPAQVMNPGVVIDPAR